MLTKIFINYLLNYKLNLNYDDTYTEDHLYK